MDPTFTSACRPAPTTAGITSATGGGVTGSTGPTAPGGSPVDGAFSGLSEPPRERGGAVFGLPAPVDPDTDDYRTALRRFAQQGQGEAALQCFGHLLRHGPRRARPVHADAGCYASTLQALQRAARAGTVPAAEQAERALRLFDAMLHLGPRMQPPVVADVRVYQALLAVCRQAGRHDAYAGLLRCALHGVPGLPHSPVLRPGLGLCASRHRLDLHVGAVLVAGQVAPGADHGVHPALAWALLHVLWFQPHALLGPGAAGLDRETRYAVGVRGIGLLRNTLRQWIEERGYQPVAAPDHTLACGARRRLPPPAPVSALNPLAAEFRPACPRDAPAAN